MGGSRFVTDDPPVLLPVAKLTEGKGVTRGTPRNGLYGLGRASDGEDVMEVDQRVACFPGLGSG